MPFGQTEGICPSFYFVVFFALCCPRWGNKGQQRSEVVALPYPPEGVKEGATDCCPLGKNGVKLLFATFVPTDLWVGSPEGINIAY